MAKKIASDKYGLARKPINSNRIGLWVQKSA